MIASTTCLILGGVSFFAVNDNFQIRIDPEIAPLVPEVVVGVNTATTSVAANLPVEPDKPASATPATTTIRATITPTTSAMVDAHSTATATLSTTVKKPLPPIRILLVAGHEPTYGGAEYHTLKERTMALTVSQYLKNYFVDNPNFEMVTVRDTNGWNPIFSDYFAHNATATKNFYLTHMAAMADKVASGEVTPVVGVPHNKAPEEVALHLYAMSKWANEQHIDLIIHLHFNDAPRPDVSVPGPYSGIALYVPERQYGNAGPSLAIAKTIFPYLLTLSGTSTLPTERGGIIEDQELIALGKYNTLTVPSLLIEYGYIYENKFQNPVTLDNVLKNYAAVTYQGVADYYSHTTK